MADDTQATKMTTEAQTQLATAVDATAGAFNAQAKATEKATRAQMRSIQQLKRLGGDKYLDLMAKAAEKMQEKTTDSFAKMAKSGNISGLKLAATIKPLTEHFGKVTSAAVKARDRIQELGVEMGHAKDSTKKAGEEYKKTSEKLTKLRTSHENLRIEIAQGKDTDGKMFAQLEKTARAIRIREVLTDKAAKKMEAATGAEEEMSTALGHEVEVLKDAEEEMGTYFERLRDGYLANRKLEYQQQSLSGGFKSIGGSMKSAALESGMFNSALSKIATGGLYAYGLKLIADAFVQVASYTAAAQAAAVQMGNTQANMGNQVMNSQKSLMAMASTAGTLGMSLEEVQTIATKFRLGTVLDRNGQLSEASIQGLTRETALFAKTAGIDTAEAAGLMEKRIKGSGMSAAEATTDMQKLRMTLIQMGAANKNNNVDLKDMVGLIEEARDASTSYVVDTRILTQALRGAATQAAAVGASSKQAADVARGIGKVLSKAPDYIKIPAGFGLVDKLMGGDSEEFLSQLTEENQKMARDLIKEVKSGATSQYTAAQVLMDMVGSEAVGAEAIFDQTKKYLQSGVAANMVAAQYGIENMSTARLVTKQLRELARAQELVGKGKLGVAMAMAQQDAEFGEMMRTTSSKQSQIAKLKEKGFDTASAKDYIKTYDQQIAAQKELDVMKESGTASADSIKAKELEITDLKIKQADISYKELDARGKALENVKKLYGMQKDKAGKPISLTTKFEAGKNTNQSFKAVADALGLEGDARDAFKTEFWDQGKAYTIHEVDTLKTTYAGVLKAADANFTGVANKFSEGFMKGIIALADQYLPFMRSGFAKLIAAIGLWVLAFYGAQRLLSKPVFVGVDAALKANPWIGGGGKSPVDTTDAKQVEGVMAKAFRWMRGNKGKTALAVALAAAVYGTYQYVTKDKKEGTPESESGPSEVKDTAMSLGNMAAAGTAGAAGGKLLSLASENAGFIGKAAGFGKGLLKKLGGPVMVAISAYQLWDIIKNPDISVKEKLKAVARLGISTGCMMLGTLVGGQIGAAVGAVGGPVGIAAGGLAGGLAGGVGGQMAGDWLGNTLIPAEPPPADKLAGAPGAAPQSQAERDALQASHAVGGSGGIRPTGVKLGPGTVGVDGKLTGVAQVTYEQNGFISAQSQSEKIRRMTTGMQKTS